MSIGRILVPLTGGPDDKISLAAAFALANSFAAHVEACFIRPDPSDAIPYLGFPDPSTEAIKEQFRLHAKRTSKQAAARARRQYNNGCKKWGVSKTRKAGEQNLSSARWREIIGRPNIEIPQLAA